MTEKDLYNKLKIGTPCWDCGERDGNEHPLTPTNMEASFIPYLCRKCLIGNNEIE